MSKSITDFFSPQEPKEKIKKKKRKRSSENDANLKEGPKKKRKKSGDGKVKGKKKGDKKKAKKEKEEKVIRVSSYFDEKVPEHPKMKVHQKRMSLEVKEETVSEPERESESESEPESSEQNGHEEEDFIALTTTPPQPKKKRVRKKDPFPPYESMIAPLLNEECKQFFAKTKMPRTTEERLSMQKEAHKQICKGEKPSIKDTKKAEVLSEQPIDTPLPPVLTRKQERLKQFLEKNERRYQWLTDIRDKQLRTPDDPDYDPSTLHIPSTEFFRMTQYEKQYWEIKQNHWDKIIFFKKGYFYELYEKDADIGKELLNLKMTERTNMRMVGIPVSRFEMWAGKLIGLGYKIVRVDQTESRISAEERMAAIKEKKKTGKKIKLKPTIISRDITEILTRGTVTEESLINDPHSVYLMSLVESKVHEDGEGSKLVPKYGVCFVDAATGEFNVGEFLDDEQRTRFESLVVHIKPQEILYTKSRLDPVSLKMLKQNLVTPTINDIKSYSDFWDVETAITEIKSANYFGESEDQSNWPKPLNKMLKRAKKDDTGGLAVAALGGCLSYLRVLKMDHVLFSLKKFNIYSDGVDAPQEVTKFSRMVLDGKTVKNLEIFENTYDGGKQGTLFHFLNHCSTAFGLRLLKKWVSVPLCYVPDLQKRVDAVEELVNNHEVREILLRALKKMPDLERLLSKVHGKRTTQEEFLLILSTLTTYKKILMDNFPEEVTKEFKSKLLKQLVTPGCKFPNISEHLRFFAETFTVKIEDDKKTIVPVPGKNPTVDEATVAFKDINDKFDAYLALIKKRYKLKKARFVTIGNKVQVMEFDILEIRKKKIKWGRDFRAVNATKTKPRFYTNWILDHLTRYEKALDALNNSRAEVFYDYIEKFEENYDVWNQAIMSVAHIDALLSLAHASSHAPLMCKPQFVVPEKAGGGIISLMNSWHPGLCEHVTDFIPNDVDMGGDEPNVILLTGPNMGGKSTLLRQVCTVVIMAQIGCFVPASHCIISPVDRIFTRIGANDNIMRGQSTFMLELLETSVVLKHATNRSLVILDELGRGTATFDGYSIAYAVLRKLAEEIGCLTLFSTHYHKLTREFSNSDNVALCHMSCIVDGEDVTFLYKMIAGTCPSSYGMNAARNAGVLPEVVDNAIRIAELFENNCLPDSPSKGSKKKKKGKKGKEVKLSKKEEETFKQLMSYQKLLKLKLQNRNSNLSVKSSLCGTLCSSTLFDSK
eukprot:CAMPEP_0174261124 /NCGR_PEP_ID=MMETSP0439-20130205/11245_1 /TAXON_ID=0 /ORGANISM="Stereomyxa ramosa, Strain Chinc5" /LENGTH=1218 /DNA_ID=CAMNT_0015345551 /DNA_START=27 /DNA_END=3684 /DNA_ORIENTATION=-